GVDVHAVAEGGHAGADAGDLEWGGDGVGREQRGRQGEGEGGEFVLGHGVLRWVGWDAGTWVDSDRHRARINSALVAVCSRRAPRHGINHARKGKAPPCGGAFRYCVDRPWGLDQKSMPRMPPMPPAAAGSSFFGSSATMASVVIIR